MLTRRDLLLALAGVGVRAPSFAADVVESVTLLALGDWGRGGGVHQREVARQLARSARARNARCVLSTGDNFYENGIESVTDPQWRTSFENVYAEAALAIPWYAVLGNHDYRGSVQAQIEYGRTSDRWRMPARWYALPGAALGAPWVDVFCLDTMGLVHRIPDPIHPRVYANQRTVDEHAQLRWLDESLAASRAGWKIVVGHHTIYSGGYHGDTGELIEDVAPILERRGAQVYLHGHDHDLQHLTVGTVHYVCSGAGSATRPTGVTRHTLFASSRPGFATLELRPERIALEFIDDAGDSMYRTLIGS